MHFDYCPHCGEKTVKKEIGDEGLVSFCSWCNVPLFDMFSTCVIIAVVNEKKEVALIKQSYVSEHYVCVAGYMKIGETAKEAASREIKEELGLDVEKLEYITDYPYPKKEMLMLGFMAVVKKVDFILSSEVEMAKWFPFKDALSFMRHGSIAGTLVKEVIRRYAP